MLCKMLIYVGIQRSVYKMLRKYQYFLHMYIPSNPFWRWTGLNIIIIINYRMMDLARDAILIPTSRNGRTVG